MLTTQTTIDRLATRIERAYRLRRASWYRGCTTSRVWTTAAAMLLQVHKDDPAIPLDPELYVAVQPDDTSFDDPWIGLIRPEAAARYRRQVRAMVRRLRAELRGEIRSAERRVGRGEELGAVLIGASHRLSPLGCYIVALRAGSDKLAERFRAGAASQHRSCPLYHQASLPLLPPGRYPVNVSSVNEEFVAKPRHLTPQPYLN